MTYNDGARFEEAEEFLKRSIGQSAPEESHLRKAYALLVYAQMRQGPPRRRAGNMPRGPRGCSRVTLSCVSAKG